jgi:hypothetical protein
MARVLPTNTQISEQNRLASASSLSQPQVRQAASDKFVTTPPFHLLSISSPSPSSMDPSIAVAPTSMASLPFARPQAPSHAPRWLQNTHRARRVRLLQPSHLSPSPHVRNGKRLHPHSDKFRGRRRLHVPVNDDYKKPASSLPVRRPYPPQYLANSLTFSRDSPDHRVSMCTLATEHTSDWLMCDAWEALQPKYQPTVNRS